MKTLEEDYGIPYSHTVMPIGIRNTDKWYRGIAKIIGKEKEVEEIISREHERIEPLVAKIRARLEGKRVFICGGTGRSFAAAALIDDFGMRDKIIISSFNHYSVKRMQALAPDMVYGFLEESRLIDTPAYVAANGVQAVHPEYHMVDEEFMEQAKKHGLAVNVWTVNTEHSMRRLVDLGVDIMIGNHPDLMGEVLKSI